MNDIRELYELTRKKYSECLNDLESVNNALSRYEDCTGYIVVKKINGKLYYYLQKRDGSKIYTQNLGRVSPGAVADEEKKIMDRKELLKRREELQYLTEHYSDQLSGLRNMISYNDDLSEYSFEVFWKDMLSARVSVKKNRVHVSRYIDHPVRQIFPKTDISRNQVNEILRLRCLEEGRPDIKEKLKAIGLTEYDPVEIVKRTHGVSFNDHIWIRFPGEEITYKDVSVR